MALLVSAAVPFWNVHPDEATYLQIAIESRERHQWLDASYFGGLNFFKPPLLYAAIRASFFLFGDSLWAARLPGLACLFWSAVVVYRWADQVAGGSAGLVAAALMLASPMALRFGHLAMMDVPLGACFLLAAVVGRRVREGAVPPWPYLFLAVAATLLLKGPALAPLVIGAFLFEAGLGALRRLVVVVWLSGSSLASSPARAGSPTAPSPTASSSSPRSLAERTSGSSTSRGARCTCWVFSSACWGAPSPGGCGPWASAPRKCLASRRASRSSFWPSTRCPLPGSPSSKEKGGVPLPPTNLVLGHEAVEPGLQEDPRLTRPRAQSIMLRRSLAP